MDNELLLFDRLNVIKDTINKYGEDKFYISFSGGKDSTILHYLIDLAIPNNRIPRVFINTGIEYNAIVNFVKDLAKSDSRFTFIKPNIPVKKMLEDYGYPFKSKEHSLYVNTFQNRGIDSKTVQRYLYPSEIRKRFCCPKKLEYQFKENFNLKISNKCCFKLKKEPIREYEKQNNKPIAITGMRKSEGGLRATIKKCVLTDRNGNVIKFHPLLVVNEDFEQWFIEKYNIKLCELYYEPYNFQRTGCKGCPYSINLEEQLKKMEKYLPNERKQCEIIWEPIYKEYRRIKYRLK